jgi:hypothetical protein
MLRFTIALLVAMFISDAAMSADRTLPQRTSHHVRHRTAVILPEGLPRRHYRFRTTILYQPSVPRLSVYENPRALYAPDYAEVSYIQPLIRTPSLPRYSTLPGYYGSIRSYDYDGPYYGGAYVDYWDRLPYACGVYGYC